MEKAEEIFTTRRTRLPTKITPFIQVVFGKGEFLRVGVLLDPSVETSLYTVIMYLSVDLTDGTVRRTVQFV